MPEVFTADSTPTITASGSGTASGSPDLVTLSVGVETRAPRAHDALTQNAALATDLIATLREAGVSSEHLQTSQVSVYPAHGNDGKIDGYQVSNTIQVSGRDAGTAGDLIDTVGARLGDAIRLHGISFSFSDPAALIAEARAAAVTAAAGTAEQLAQAAGVRLGRILAIRETPGFAAPIGARAKGVAFSASTPIESGSQELSVSVEVVYALEA